MTMPTKYPAPATGTAQGGGPAKAIWAFDAIGTRWEIETRRLLDGRVRAEIQDRIERFDLAYSRFRPDSLVSRIAAAQQGGRFVFPEDAAALFDLYDRLAAVTGGAIDPLLVGRELELLGYDAAYTLRPVAPAAWPAGPRPVWGRDTVREGTVLTTGRPVVVDVGAAGKGYLVDLAAALLTESGIGAFVVAAGGDLRHAGPQPIRIGLEYPADPSQVIGVANLRDRALCASAVNRRAWGDGLHHILDARTGIPAAEVVATWVVADDAAHADALATALFVTDPRTLGRSFAFDYVRLLDDGRAEISSRFPGALFGPEAQEDRS
ncbi:FAD:protein FMN transferase [Nonomuraea sp. NPDC049129]|uniref:FAD:protein FMN transferase n=1 Tax=Nonomuraea sp. NPDC049129 TaxID=3155272 RepID=UPI0033FD88E9